MPAPSLASWLFEHKMQEPGNRTAVAGVACVSELVHYYLNSTVLCPLTPSLFFFQSCDMIALMLMWPIELPLH